MVCYFQYIDNGFTDISNCNCNKNKDVIHNSLSNYQPIYFNNPERVVRPRSSQTIVKKNYYTTTKAYLKSRVKLYDQNQLLSKSETLNIDYNKPPSSNNWVYAENDPRKGSQSFYSTNCISDPSACCQNNDINQCKVNITFKPNNPFFAVQGAVDSSTRIIQAKYQAITTNNYNFSKNNGLIVYKEEGNGKVKDVTLFGATPVKYRGDTKAPVFY